MLNSIRLQYIEGVWHLCKRQMQKMREMLTPFSLHNPNPLQPKSLSPNPTHILHKCNCNCNCSQLIYVCVCLCTIQLLYVLCSCPLPRWSEWSFSLNIYKWWMSPCNYPQLFCLNPFVHLFFLARLGRTLPSSCTELSHLKGCSIRLA